MYKRYYDSYRSGTTCADNGEIITPKCTDDTYHHKCAETNFLECCENSNKEDFKPCCQNECCDKKTSFSLPCEIDDLILIGILFLLLKDNDSIDPIIPIIIGFVLLSDGF